MTPQPTTRETALATIPDPAAIQGYFTAIYDGTQQALADTWTAIKENDPSAAMQAMTVLTTGVEQIRQFADDAIGAIGGAAAVVDQLLVEAEQAKEAYQLLEAGIDDVQAEAYESGLHHFEECPDCQAAYDEMVLEADREGLLENASYYADELRKLGKADDADDLEKAVAAAVEARDQADTLMMLAQQATHQAWQAAPNATVDARRAAAVLDDDDEEEFDEETEAA
jgi:hypothetical protein